MRFVRLSVAAMPEQVHERASEDQQERQQLDQVRAMARDQPPHSSRQPKP